MDALLESFRLRGHFTRYCLELFLHGYSMVEAWPRGKTRVQRMSSAGLYAKANLGSRLFFTFYFPFIKIGLKRTITQDDILGQLPPWMETEVAYEKLSSLWADRLLRRKSRGEQPSLFQIILLSNWELLVPVLLSRVAIVLFSYTLPVILNELLSYLEDYESKPLSYGITLAIGIFVSSLFASLVNTYNRYQMILIGVRTRAALIAMIYRKALRLSAKARSESTNGEITNHMSVDADQWWDMFSFLSMWISIPLEIAIAMKLLYGLLGWTMLAGVLTMLAMLPVQTWQAKFFKSMQAEKLKAMDQRVQLTTEVLSSMKIIKLYGWSTAFINRILAVRSKELNILKRIGIVEAFMSIIFISSSLIISLVTFSVYALWGGPGFTPGKLTLQTVFVSMTLFSMLKNPISSLSDATASTLSVLVATKRIQRFFLLEEIDDKNIMRFDLLPRDPDDPLILIKDGTFSWIAPVDEGYEDNRVIDERSALLQDHGSSEPQLTLPPTLRSINLSFGRGKLTAIVGRVGQGKSSLLSAMIGELYKLQGKIQISGHVAYVPQQAWIINKTLKDNILFGKRYDEERYKQVIFACGLEPDLAVLPAGDMTEIGERGINLSGGQKQRVSLARAAYDDADIYLLDDPLSAVDAHVSHHLWNHLLGSTGLLRDKTRVLVTHGIHHLREVDQIVVLHEGMVAENGPYSELMANKKIFYRLIKEYSKLERRSSSTPKVAKTGIKGGDKTRIKPGNATISTNIPNDADDSGEATEGDESGDISDQSTSNNTTVAANNQEFKDDKKDTKAGIITVEAIKEGAVGYGVGILYAKAVSYLVSTMVVLLFVLAQICLVSTSLWLKHWINENKRRDENNPPSIVRFLGVYALLTLIYVLLYMIIMWLALAVGRIRASERIHYDFLNKIMHLPIAFFDTTPLGRIINRFSSDVGTVDVKLSSKLIGILLFGTSVMSTLILVVSTTPSFIFVAPLFMAAYYLALICFLSVNQILARIYAASKSPIYQHFNESLGGVSTLRAMKIQSRFVRENTDLTDRNSNNFLSNMGSRRWMDVQLRLLSTIIVFITALFAVLERERMDPSMVGLTLSFALSITEEVTSL
ncbi:Multidrug resistance-associated protein 1, partial [Lobosporangium transversale]